ncbi:MAG: F0F1 ATP synthase subunit B [Roseiflexaceae bacterium]|nr:F0F1 ATP synthase subunit B [Roseiflexaceae bacterium]
MEALGINYGLIVAHILNLGLLVWLLTALLYKPVLGILNALGARIQTSLREAEQVKTQLASAQTDYEAELARGRQQAAQIVVQANERAKGQEAEILAQARIEAERIRSEARAQSLQERDQLLSDLKGQMATLITVTAEKVISAELRTNHDRLIEESLSQLGRQN